MASVAGDIELMPVVDIVSWMASRRPTATLTVRRRDVESRFTIREGMCTQAASSDPREFLGQHLINFGYVDEEGLQRAFDTQKETRVPLGRVLVMVDALTPEQLQRVLTFKTREGMLEALCWEDGSWKITPGVDTDRELDCQWPVDLREVASEAGARRQMWVEIRRMFPSDATRCEVLGDGSSVSSLFDRRLMTLMAAGKTIGEAALELRAMDFQTYARLYDLANRQLLRARTTTSEVSVDELAQLDILQGFVVAAGPMGSSSAHEGVRAFELAPPDDFADMVHAAPEVARVPPAAVGSGSTATAAGVHAGSAAGGSTSPAPGAGRPGPSAWGSPSPPPTNSSTGAQHALASAPSAPVVGGPQESALDHGTSRAGGVSANAAVRIRPEPVQESPGVAVPAEAQDPLHALSIALAGRNWAEALLLAQRVLERDPSNLVAISAVRVADINLRKGAPTTAELDLNRAPRWARPREQIAQAHLSSKERYVLSRVDGTRTLAQIASVSPISRTELVRIVDAFVARGVLLY
jgi:hypothetical protein